MVHYSNKSHLEVQTILKAMGLGEIIQIKNTERKRQRRCPRASHLSKVKKKEKANKKNWKGGGQQ